MRVNGTGSFPLAVTGGARNRGGTPRCSTSLALKLADYKRNPSSHNKSSVDSSTTNDNNTQNEGIA